MRTALYVAAHRPEHLAKAWHRGADAVVVELEDGVPGPEKDRAREAMVEALSRPVPGPAEVRVNGRGSGLLVADVVAVAGTTATAVRLPKVESPDDVLLVAGLLEELGSDARVLPLLETARGVSAADDIARCHPRVGGLLMGEEDLRADLGVGAAGIDALRLRLVLAARAAGLPAPLQSVWTALDDLDGLRRDCERGKELGLRGRSVIHPRQVPVVNEVFTPTPDEVIHAREVVDRVGAGRGGGAVLDDGTFVDDATVLRAQQVLTDARAAGR